MKQTIRESGPRKETASEQEAVRGRYLPEGTEVNRNLPIQVAALCDTTGKIHPLWFRYADEENRVRKVEIDSILSRKTIHYVGIQIEQYICASSFRGRTRTYEIRYSVESHRWHFFRMID